MGLGLAKMFNNLLNFLAIVSFLPVSTRERCQLQKNRTLLLQISRYHSLCQLPKTFVVCITVSSSNSMLLSVSLSSQISFITKDDSRNLVGVVTGVACPTRFNGEADNSANNEAARNRYKSEQTASLATTYHGYSLKQASQGCLLSVASISILVAKRYNLGNLTC